MYTSRETPPRRELQPAPPHGQALAQKRLPTELLGKIYRSQQEVSDAAEWMFSNRGKSGYDTVYTTWKHDIDFVRRGPLR